MNTFIDYIHSFIEKHALLPAGSTIIVGLSGGPDSVFLLHFLATLKAEKKLTLIAAHLDHQWRADSHKDVLFCEQLTLSLAIPFVSMKRSDLPGLYTGSKEEQGRKARRAFFEQLKKQYHADAIALAHHAQDQQETFFMRLMRGTSLTGLTAIKPSHADYIRPLLKTNKSDIVAYLDEHSIAYLTDPTNSSSDFLRNRIRHTILPACTQADARFNHNFMFSLDRLQETEELLVDLTQEAFKKIALTSTTGGTALSLSGLLSLAPLLRQRVIFSWLWKEKVSFTPTQNFLNEIFRFLENKRSTRHKLGRTWALVKIKNILTVEKHIP